MITGMGVDLRLNTPGRRACASCSQSGGFDAVFVGIGRARRARS